jgi:MFS family permease
MVDMRMLAYRPVLVANLTALLAGFALFSSFVLVPNLVQFPSGLPPELARLADYGFGASATTTGLYLLPGAISGFVTGPLAGIMARRYGVRWPLSLGMALAAVGLVFLAEWHAEPWQVAVAMFILGAGIPFTFAAMAKAIVDSVRPSETGVATGINTVMRTVGGVVGGQIGAAILAAHAIGRTDIPAESGFTTAFWAGAVAAVVAAFVALAVTPWREARAPRLAELPE